MHTFKAEKVRATHVGRLGDHLKYPFPIFIRQQARAKVVEVEALSKVRAELFSYGNIQMLPRCERGKLPGDISPVQNETGQRGSGRWSTPTFRHCARSPRRPKVHGRPSQVGLYIPLPPRVLFFFVHPSKSIEFLMPTGRSGGGG